MSEESKAPAMRMRIVVAALAATALLASAGSAHGAEGTWERAWGKDVIQSGRPGDLGAVFEVCIVAADCKFGVAGGLGGELSGSHGVATDGDGNVYVTETFNDRIQKFDASGEFLLAWGRNVIQSGKPGDLGDVFEVCEVADDCQAGTAGSLGGELNDPGAVATDAAGNVYVAEQTPDRVSKFDSSGTWERTWGKNVIQSGRPGDLGAVFEVCTVAEDCQAGTAGSLGGEMFVPSGIATDGAGNVYVSDRTNVRIQKFSSLGAWERAWGKDVISGNAETGFEICTVPGAVPATDFCKGGTAGTLGGELNTPDEIAADSTGTVYIADLNNDRIQKFDSSGTWDRAWGKDVIQSGRPGDLGVVFEVCTVAADCKANAEGGLGGEFASPSGVATDGANLYVADPGNRRVQKFDSSGAWDRAWGKDVIQSGRPGDLGDVFEVCNVAADCKFGDGGSLGGEFAANGPNAVALDAVENLYVAEFSGIRIQKFADPCTITGTQGDDFLIGTPGPDVICGLGGKDRLGGRGGGDVLIGGGGDDLLFGGNNSDSLGGGTGDDELIGESGVDALDGGAGANDTANYNPGATQGVEVDLATGAVANDGLGFAETVANVERVEGAQNQVNDLTGDGADNRLIGGLLADELSGAGGADLLRGEVERAPSGGNDTLTGGDGADTIFPGTGSNTIDGGTGSDTLQYTGLGTALGVTVNDVDGAGTTTGAATDTFSGIENVTGTPNADDITVDWTGVASLVIGRDGADALSTQDGDTLDTMNGGDGVDVCNNADGETAISC